MLYMYEANVASNPNEKLSSYKSYQTKLQGCFITSLHAAMKDKWHYVHNHKFFVEQIMFSLQRQNASANNKLLEKNRIEMSYTDKSSKFAIRSSSRKKMTTVVSEQNTNTFYKCLCSRPNRVKYSYFTDPLEYFFTGKHSEHLLLLQSAKSFIGIDL